MPVCPRFVSKADDMRQDKMIADLASLKVGVASHVIEKRFGRGTPGPGKRSRASRSGSGVGNQQLTPALKQVTAAVVRCSENSLDA